MKKDNILILAVFLISLLFILETVLAINATSSNYSIGRFGTGLATANASSANYQAISLTESTGTTRNAESDSVTVNIGFFSNTVYYRTVSISSYSVYPKVSEAVSSIRLYISALNYESVWANITRPDSVVERVELTNNDYKYYTAGIIGRYNITFYANSSTGALSSVLDYFDVTEEDDDDGGGGGGDDDDDDDDEEEITIESCTYYWDCTPWSVCADGKQTRECKNIGTCNGTTNKPLEQMNCSEALFDIFLILDDLKINEDENISFNINLTEKFGVEKIDVTIKYSIINNTGYEIFSQIETKAVQGSLNYKKEISDIKLSEGDYILRVDALYGSLQRAFTEQKFKISKKESVADTNEKKRNKFYFFNNLDYRFILMFAALIVILFLIILVYKRRKPKSQGEKVIERKLKEGLDFLKKGNIAGAKKNYSDIKFIYEAIGKVNNNLYSRITDFYTKITKSLVVISASLLPFLFAPMFLRKIGLTGNFIGTGNGEVSVMFILVLSLISLFLLMFSAGKLVGILQKKSNKNTLSELISKEVYSSDGYVIGKVREIILERNKIHSLIINLDKKYNSSKGIIVEYKWVKNIKNVVIIDEKVITHLN